MIYNEKIAKQLKSTKIVCDWMYICKYDCTILWYTNDKSFFLQNNIKKRHVERQYYCILLLSVFQ